MFRKSIDLTHLHYIVTLVPRVQIPSPFLFGIVKKEIFDQNKLIEIWNLGKKFNLCLLGLK